MEDLINDQPAAWLIALEGGKAQVDQAQELARRLADRLDLPVAQVVLESAIEAMSVRLLRMEAMK